MRLVISLFWTILLSTPFVASAQETRGTILGRVTDPSGAVVAGAEVRATNAATGVAVSARSNESGNYVLPYLLTGDYAVEAQMAGFKKSVLEGIELRINDRVEVNIELQVGRPPNPSRSARRPRCSTPLQLHSDRWWMRSGLSICPRSAAA
jgi:hypothetical protein